VSVIKDLEFSKPDRHPLRLDLYLPEQKPANPLPVIVWIHGGGWLNGSKENAKNASWLATKGFAVASINYRLTTEATWPAQIDDCRESVRWLRANAKTYGLDPDHIGAFGSSAGGHLAALMGTRPYPDAERDTSRIQAVCDWFGPTELLTMPPNMIANGRTEEQVANSNGAKLLGATVKDVPDLAKEASALDNVTADDAPFLIMHGSADPGVPTEQSKKLHAKLVSSGVHSEFHIVEGAGHGGPQFSTPEVRAKVEAFFYRTLRP
jgi:acetyl esterase/lipase